MRYEFGEFTLDLAEQELRRGGATVHLTPKAMQLLGVLIEHRPKVVSRQDLYDQLWPDVVVQEANLKNLIADLREALDDHERKGKFLRTVHGRGYAFTKDVVATEHGGIARSSRLVVFHAGSRRLILPVGESVIGRDADADVVIDDPEVSRYHARVVIGPDRATIEDLGSKNGTFVGANRIDSPVELRHGDEVRLGHFSMTVKIMLRNEETETA